MDPRLKVGDRIIGNKLASQYSTTTTGWLGTVKHGYSGQGYILANGDHVGNRIHIIGDHFDFLCTETDCKEINQAMCRTCPLCKLNWEKHDNMEV